MQTQKTPVVFAKKELVSYRKLTIKRDSIARSYRNTRQWRLALTRWRHGCELFEVYHGTILVTPDDVDWLRWRDEPTKGSGCPWHGRSNPMIMVRVSPEQRTEIENARRGADGASTVLLRAFFGIKRIPIKKK